jgi:hypothetical protein
VTRTRCSRCFGPAHSLALSFVSRYFCYVYVYYRMLERVEVIRVGKAPAHMPDVPPGQRHAFHRLRRALK